MATNLNIMPLQVESSVESPEALLRLIDAQIAATRAQRKEISPHRAVILAASIFFILGGGMAAFALLFTAVTNHAHKEPAVHGAVSPQVVHQH